MSFSVRSIEKYIPEQKISSIALDLKAGIRSGWIEKNTGVYNRHWAANEEGVCDMGAKALISALNSARLSPADLDLLIFAGGSFDYMVPHNSVVIKSLITDDTNTFNCFDIDTTCLSWIQAIEVASLYLSSGKYKRIAVVCSEKPSAVIHPSDPKVFGLFGDAAVATILEREEQNDYKVIYSDFQNFPSGALNTMVPMGGGKNRGMGMNVDNPDFYFQMQGKKLMKLSAQHLKNFINRLESNAGIGIDEIDYVIPHQPSKIANDYFVRECGLNPSKVITTIANYGNCVSASIPLGLEQVLNNESDSIKGKKILLIGSGAGFTLGCILLQA